jgi:hypothetical protein
MLPLVKHSASLFAACRDAKCFLNVQPIGPIYLKQQNLGQS